MPSTVELAQIEPTTRCNFTCGYCCGRHMPQRDLPFDTFAHILDAFPGLKHIELQGEGEPMLHHRFIDMIALARSRGIDVSFICNGSLLEPGRVAKILDLGVQAVVISIDSADPDMFREIRGGALSKVVRGIETLLEARRARQLGRPTVGLQVTVLRKTLEALPGILQLYRQLGMDGGIGLQPLQRMEGYTDCYPPDMIEQMLGAREIQQFQDTHRELLREIWQERRHGGTGYYEQLFEGWTPDTGTCPWLEKAAYVACDGNYTPCCTIKDTTRYGLPPVPVSEDERLLTARGSLAAELREGRLPRPCHGCGLADQIIAAHRARRAPGATPSPARDANVRLG